MSEMVLGIACWGTYDEGDDISEHRVRGKAVRLGAIKYKLLVRSEGLCQCGRCQVEPVKQVAHLETEP